MISAATAGSFWLNSVPMYSMSGYVAICSSKPCWRRSVVEMPGLTLITITVPSPPISSASASAAATPPPKLSDAIRDAPIDSSLTTVSTRITWMPSSWARCSGAGRCLDVVGRDEDGVWCAGNDRVEDRVLQRGVEGVGPCTSRVMPPMSAAASWTPHSIVT